MTYALRALLVAALVSTFSPAFAQMVGGYVSSPKTFQTASWWIEGRDGIVLIDTQFLPSETLRAVEEAESTSRKKVALAVVLHPNPDKFNGTAALQARGIRVVTSRQVAEKIPGVHATRLGWFFDDFKPEYPKDAPKPDVFGDATQTIDVAGIALKLHVLGPGTSAAHVVAQAGDAVFVGDLVNPDNHAWLELGMIDEWLKRLDEVGLLYPKRVYPGRGAPGGPELIDRQRSYLRYVQQIVREMAPKGELGTFKKWRLAMRIQEAYPMRGYPNFMRDGLGELWRVEASKR